ncbi:MAG: beta-ketoacyl-ACP synthase III, partial [Solirubrobacteraceae bacterium]
VGTAVPERVIENAPIADRLGVDDRWIVSRTGIRQRHALRSGERLSQLAAAAGQAVLERTGLDPADIDLVLVATTSKDELTPDAAPQVAAELGARGAGAIDVGAACTGFISALALARGQIESGTAERVLVVGADALVRYLDPDDRRTAALFGDGAGAVVVAAIDPPGRISNPVLRADGTQAELIYATQDERKIRMQGQETFRSAVRRLKEVTQQALSLADTEADDVDLFVYHQANQRILSAVGERLGLPEERMVDCIERYGNTSAASIPLALAEAEAGGTLVDGSRLLLAAFGAGFTWGGVVVDWGLDGAKRRSTRAMDDSAKEVKDEHHNSL